MNSHKHVKFNFYGYFFIFSEFYVRWVDDNHALGIFGIASHAAQALRENQDQQNKHNNNPNQQLLPVVKLRTLNQAGRLTQLKAQRLIGKLNFKQLRNLLFFSQFFVLIFFCILDQIIMEQANTLPSVERPQTSAVIAKRLINGHLGIKD